MHSLGFLGVTLRIVLLARAVLGVLRSWKVMKPDEFFDPQLWKTKLIFVIVQFLYTLLTFLPVPLLYRFKFLNAAYVT